MRTIISLTALALLVTPAFGQGTLYFSEDGNPNGLYSISTATGAATHLGASGVSFQTVGLAPSALDTELHGSDPYGINLVQTSGSGFINVGPATAEALAYDYATDTLYGAINGNFGEISTVTGDYVSSLNNSPQLDWEGLAFGNRGVYGLPGFADTDTFLWWYDPGPDTWTSIGDTGIDWYECALAYDPYNDVLYAKDDGDTMLYRIDPASGATSAVGDTGILEGGGLAYVPEPASLALVGLGGLLLRRRRR